MMLIVLLVLNGLYQLQFGVQMLIAPESFYEFSSIPFSDIREFTILNRLLGCAQLFLAGAAALSVRGTVQGNPLGGHLGVLLGIFIITVGLAVVGHAQAFLVVVDLVRGTLTVALGLLTIARLKS